MSVDAVFAAIRRVVVFGLGVVVIVAGITGGDDASVELVIGALMVGVLPLDNVVRAWREGTRR